MWTRYVLPCILVMGLALGIGFLTYRLTSVTYVGTCTFQVSLPPTAENNNPSTLDFQIRKSALDVSQVTRSDIYSGPASAVGEDPSTVAGETSVTQVPNGTQFVLAVTDPDAAHAADLANRVCDEVVARITSQQQAAKDNEVAQLQQRITVLAQSIAGVEATPPNQRTAADAAFDAAQKQAITAEQQLMAQALASPADNVSVLTRAPGGVRNDTRNLTRNLLVAGAAGLLACFIIILVGEIARDSVRPTVP